MTIEVSADGVTWTDISNRVTRATHKIASRELETLEFTVTNPSSAISVGMYVRARRGTATVFEGIIYEARRQKAANVVEYDVRAYSELVLYDRRVVFRLYDTGTAAGEIIRDLASLESGVDLTNVDDGPSLTSPWSIENVPALRVMLDVAKGTNYYIRMKPGRVLFFKPKAVGTPKATLDDANVLAAEYAEDRWRLKNRVIYVGAGGEVLADVSEPPGDLPVVVHDPYLTDSAEALRRAQIRLALNKEFGRQLRIVVPMRIVENVGLDLFDTVRVNITDLGLTNADLYVVEMSFDPREKKYELTLGGRLELFEDYLSEALGGDVASRFGGGARREEEIMSTITSITREIEGFARLSSTSRHPVYVNKPPLTLYNALNVTLNSDGEAVLISGASSGSFEVRFLPPSKLTFVNYIEAYWDARPEGGSISASVLDARGNAILNVSNAAATRYITLPRWPRALNHLTYRSASGWATAGASVSDVKLGPVGGWCLKMVPSTLGTYGTITYPASGDLNLDLTQFRYLRLYLYGDHANNFIVRVRLLQDTTNYLEGNLTVNPNEWQKHEAVLSTFSRTGSPERINAISISSPYVLLIDSDHVLLSHLYETLRLRFSLSRPNATYSSPRVGTIRIAWREGGA